MNWAPVLLEPPIVNGRVPPHDLQAEAAVLSACLLDRHAIDLVAPLVTPDDFYADAHRLIWDATIALHSVGQPVDTVSVASWLRSRELISRAGGAVYIARVVDATPAVGNVATHAEIVRERSRIRRVIGVCQKYAAEGYGSIDSAQGFLDELETEVHGVVHAQGVKRSKRLKEALGGTFQKLAAAAARGDAITGIPTRLADLDRKTAGLHRGDLAIVAARPGMGKTALVLNIAVNVASPEVVRLADDEQGYPVTEQRCGVGVAVFSLEMPEDQLSQRIVCSEARVDLAKMRQGYLNEEDWAQLTAAASVLSALPIEIDDTPAVSLLELRSKARRMQSEMRREGVTLGLIVIDYLQLMRGRAGAPRNQNREQEIGEISRGLKQLAKELDVAVIALSQLNRGVETRSAKDKRPMLSDLRESGSLEQDADIVLLIYRDEYYFKNSDAKGLAELIIAKQRNGPTGTVRARFIGSCTRFESLAPGAYEDHEDHWT